MIAKRALDLLASAVGLVLLAPVLALIAAWIKCDSRGPVLFMQERVGRNGQLFRIVKFRTMIVAAAHGESQLTIGADARITRAGVFLRRYKLDELPQLWNVLRGQMSLVGPRPEVPRYVAHYSPEQRARVLALRPGITDAASIQFANESELLGQSADPERTYVEVLLPLKIRAYEQYAANRSFWGDVKLILQTVLVSARPDGSTPKAAPEP